MKFIAISILSALVTSTAFAGPVQPAGAKAAGINEAVTISLISSPNIWGSTFEMTGFYSGTGVNKLIPVTREAAAVLQKLDPKLSYNCVILNSTKDSKYQNGQDLGSVYYVLDINCD